MPADYAGGLADSSGVRVMKLLCWLLGHRRSGAVREDSGVWVKICRRCGRVYNVTVVMGGRGSSV